MKTHIYAFLLFITLSSTQIFGEKTTYKIVKDLHYYSEDKVSSDSYINERCKLDIYYPTNKEDFATIIWIHAGGLKRGNKYIPGELRNKDMAIVSINYRLYPKAKCPDFIEDAAAAVAWVINNIEDYGGSKDKVILSGASAGAYLNMMVSFEKKWLAPYGIDPDQLLGIAPLSGQTITHVAVREEMGGDRMLPVIDKWSPLYHIRKDTPPIMLVTGDRDLELLGRYEENAYLHRMFLLKGNKNVELFELEGFTHGELEKPAYNNLLKFIKTLLNPESKKS